MQYANTNAFRAGDRVVIHQPHQPAKTYSYIDGRLVPRTRDPWDTVAVSNRSRHLKVTLRRSDVSA